MNVRVVTLNYAIFIYADIQTTLDYCLCLDSVSAHREVSVLFGLLDGHTAGLCGGELSSDGAGLLLSKIHGQLATLGSVVGSELGLGVGVDDSQHAGNILADSADSGHTGGLGRVLLDTQVGQVLLQVLELLGELALGLVS